VFLFADGNPWSSSSYHGLAIQASSSPTESLYEDWLFAKGVDTRYDHNRHRGKINVVFVDGHGETVQMPDPSRDDQNMRDHGDFQRIGVTKGIFD